MKKKEITLCGKPITLAYCFATELNFGSDSEQPIADFLNEIIEYLTALDQPPQEGQEKKQEPNIYDRIRLIMGATDAYYHSIGKDTPISRHDLLYSCTPTEMWTAIGTILALRADFYRQPTSDTTVPDASASEQEEEPGKNA